MNKAGMTDTFSFNVDGTTAGVHTAGSPLGSFMGMGPISPLTSPYSITLTEVITASGAAGSQVSSDFNLTGTPEPGLYAMTGIGLMGLTALAIRRKNKQVSEL
jgi:hypothetical protein